MAVSRDELIKLLQLLAVTETDEIDCEEFLVRVAGFLERLGPDGTPPEGYEDVVQHLRVCPECLEEFGALLETL